MFKNFKKNEKYFSIALYAFIVIALLIGLIFAFINLDRINVALRAFFSTISPFIIGFVIAYICNPLYKRLSTYVFKFVDKGKPRPKLKKTLSIILTYIILFSLIAIALFIVIPAISDSIAEVENYNIGKWYDEIVLKVDEWFPGNETIADWKIEIEKFLFVHNDGEIAVDANGNKLINFESIIGKVSSYLDLTPDYIASQAISLVKVLFSVIVGVILSVYFLIHGQAISAKIKKILASLFKKSTYERIIDFAKYTDKTFGKYLIGTIIDSVIVGIVVGLLMWITGMPQPVLIGFIVSITNVIPFFGPFIGAIPSAFIILIASGEFWRVLVFVVIIVVVQQLDGNILAPHIIGASIGLTPIGVIAATLICEHFFGILGMVIGVPLCAVLSYILSNVVNKKLKKKNLPSDTELYKNPDIFKNEEFVKASLEVEAQTRIEMKEASEKVKENLELHQLAIQEAQERIINEKEQTAETDAFSSTIEIDAIFPENKNPN